MRQFIKRALQKADKLKAEQFRELLVLASEEIDRLETVMDSLIRGVLVCDSGNNLIIANKAARRLLSIVSFEQGRETVWSVIPDETVADFLARTLAAGDNVDEKEFSVDVNGTTRLLSFSVMPMVQEHQVTGSLILINDITEIRNREAKMRRMESLASLTTLAAGVAHEIKNPLGALSIHVQLIQKAAAGQEALCAKHNEMSGSECESFRYFRQIDKHLKVVNEEIDRLNGIVVDFLFAVRPVNAQMRRGNINDLVTELADFVSLELQNSGIECVLDLDENLSAVDFDFGLMKQALLNVVQNAEAAMGGVAMNGSAINGIRKLTITTADMEEEVFIIIADTGVGISEENLSKIFEPYFTTKESGTGLGLTVLFKIIKEHQGEVIVSSREGKGTVFTIALPKPQVKRKMIAYQMNNEE
ncbi:MAG: PAS domain S-box protein [Treponema sp.]|jgi:PAS domain S-box-containing protein|nr:PAS domain S-box protein [Treponema sp.]